MDPLARSTRVGCFLFGRINRSWGTLMLALSFLLSRSVWSSLGFRVVSLVGKEV